MGPPAHRAAPAPSPLPARSPACHPAPSPAHAPRRAAPRTISPLRPLPTSSPFGAGPSVPGVRRDLPAFPPLLSPPSPSLFSLPLQPPLLPAHSPSPSPAAPLSLPHLFVSAENWLLGTVPTLQCLWCGDSATEVSGEPGRLRARPLEPWGAGRWGQGAVRRGASWPGAAGTAVTVPDAPAVSRSRGQRGSQLAAGGQSCLVLGFCGWSWADGDPGVGGSLTGWAGAGLPGIATPEGLSVCPVLESRALNPASGRAVAARLPGGSSGAVHRAMTPKCLSLLGFGLLVRDVLGCSHCPGGEGAGREGENCLPPPPPPPATGWLFLPPAPDHGTHRATCGEGHFSLR